MTNYSKENLIYKIYWWGLVIKWLNALSEIVGGLLVYFVSKTVAVNYILSLVMGELKDDPEDKFGLFIVNSVSDFSTSSKTFLAVYLFTHGLLKTLAIIGLFTKKLWAYPISLIIFSVFVTYQMYRYYFTHSIWMLFLSIFDAMLIWLIWHEYKRARKGLLT